MPRNIEIKAHIADIEDLERKVAKAADSGPTLISQDDTFFRCDNGRLKLRSFSQDSGELIYYRRADASGPKESFYVISETSNPQSLRKSLELAYGTAGRVKKLRTLYFVGRTRLHLDRVEELGSFLELEVVLTEGESSEEGVQEAQNILSMLGVGDSQLIEGAYVDLLNQKDG